MHRPEFPPKISEWLPSTPPLPPLPSWVFNPLTPEQRALLEGEFGKWAAGRTIGMISPRETFETHRRVAQRMYETVMGKSPPRARETREPTAERRRRAPTIAEELAPVVGVLTPEQESTLVNTALEAITDDIQRRKRRPKTGEIQEYSKMVVDWAEMEGARISETKGAEIVEKALDGVEAELARRAPARRAGA